LHIEDAAGKASLLELSWLRTLSKWRGVSATCATRRFPC